MTAAPRKPLLVNLAMIAIVALVVLLCAGEAMMIVDQLRELHN